MSGDISAGGVKKADRFRRPLDFGDAAVGQCEACRQDFKEAFVEMHLTQAG